ncbi:MAG TPA: hypothetical protein VNT53_06575 [Pseudolysinimonas sp.]|nr:hypothetical protein [Pseudolysinimonas sp.]
MQLGTRWTVGAEPPSRVPEVLAVAIASVEADLETAGVDASTWRWTLTFLEQRPIAELDDGTIVRLGYDGKAVIEEPTD